MFRKIHEISSPHPFSVDSRKTSRGGGDSPPPPTSNRVNDGCPKRLDDYTGMWSHIDITLSTSDIDSTWSGKQMIPPRQ